MNRNTATTNTALGPSVHDTYLMLITTENYKLAFTVAAQFELDPILVLETLADKCGKDPHFAVTSGWEQLRR